MRSSESLSRWWPTPLVGLLGGALASLAHWPLPWMIGPLLAVIALRCCGCLVGEIPRGRQTGQWIVATSLGLHFTAEVWQQVLAHFPIIFLGAAATLLLGLIGIAVLLRSGVDRPTAYFASMPGGASEMVNLALRHGADPARVAAAHSLRLLAVVLIVPALFTWSLPAQAPGAPAEVNWAWLALLMPGGALTALLWRRLGQPNPWMLGPLTFAAVVSVNFDLHIGLPHGAGQIGQFLIGTSLACHFDGPFFRNAPAFLLRVLLATLLAMLFAAGLGWLLGSISSLPSQPLMLGMMPGGITELSLVAEALHLAVALVIALQVLRLFLVLFLSEPVYRLWNRRFGQPR